MTSMTYALNSCYQEICVGFLITIDSESHLHSVSLSGKNPAASRGFALYKRMLVGVFLH